MIGESKYKHNSFAGYTQKLSLEMAEKQICEKIDCEGNGLNRNKRKRWLQTLVNNTKATKQRI